MTHLKINISPSDNLDDVLQQLNGTSVPCVIHIYDRVLQFASKDELRMFIYGCEVGNFVAIDKKEGNSKL